MKRLVIMLLALGLLLCACGKKDTEVIDTKPAVATEATEAATVPTTEPPETTVPETTVPQETEPAYRHPLTGEGSDQPFTHRPEAVTINNIKECLPQFGISDADWFFEIETEGGITRCLAVFSDLEGVGSVGPVRSTRSYFNNLARSFQAPLFHCGGSVSGLNGLAGQDYSTKIGNWEHMDGRFGGPFFRDQERLNSGHYAMEHTMFTNGSGMDKAMESKGFNKTQAPESFGYEFSEEVDLKGSPANKVTVKFDAYKDTIMTYDAASGLYKAGQYGTDWVDAGKGETLRFKNILVLETEHRFATEGSYTRSYYTLVGSGSGHLAVNGQMVPIRWTRNSVEEPFRFSLEDGSPVTLGVGSTYCAIVGGGRDTAAE